MSVDLINEVLGLQSKPSYVLKLFDTVFLYKLIFKF